MKYSRVLKALIVVMAASASLSLGAYSLDVVDSAYHNSFSFMAQDELAYQPGDYVLVTRSNQRVIAVAKVSFSRSGYVYCDIVKSVMGRTPGKGDVVTAAGSETMTAASRYGDDAVLVSQWEAALFPSFAEFPNQRPALPISQEPLISSGRPTVIAGTTLAPAMGELEISIGADGRSITMNAKNAQLAQVLREISARTGAAVYVDPAAQYIVSATSVTHSFKNIALDAALAEMLRKYGLSYFHESGRFHIVPASAAISFDESKEPLVIEKIQLNYADAETVRDMLLSMRLRPLPDVVVAYSGPALKNTDPSLSVGGRQQGETTRMLPNEQIVSAKKDLLIIKATEEVQEQVKKVVELVDVSPKQVVIKTLILEVNRNNLNDRGADSIEFPSFNEYGTSVFTGDFAEGKYDISIATQKTLEERIKTMYMNLHVLLQNNKAKILNNPTIATVDGQPAMIRVGKEIPLERTTMVSKEGVAVTSKETDYKHIGMSLYVLPRVHSNGKDISLLIHPELSEMESDFKLHFKETPPMGLMDMVDSIAGTEYGANAQGATTMLDGALPQSPNIIVRESNSIVQVANGEEVIIGGLIRRDNKTRVKKMPLLGDMPLIGNLFRRQSDYVDEQELIIIMVPFVMDKLPGDEKIGAPVFDMIYKNYSDINEEKRLKNKDKYKKKQ